jgi:hypothetical protein
MICHDDNLQRLCGSNINMNDTHLDDLPKFLPKTPMHFSRNQFYRMKDDDQRTYSSVEECF